MDAVLCEEKGDNSKDCKINWRKPIEMAANIGNIAMELGKKATYGVSTTVEAILEPMENWNICAFGEALQKGEAIIDIVLESYPNLGYLLKKLNCKELNRLLKKLNRSTSADAVETILNEIL